MFSRLAYLGYGLGVCYCTVGWELEMAIELNLSPNIYLNRHRTRNEN